MAGRLSLVKSIIYGSFLHSFLVYKWPASLLKTLEKAICNFLWIGSIFQKKLVTIKQDQCCKPFDEGGVGLKRLHSLNKAFLSKIAWCLGATKDYIYSFLWAHFLSSSKLPRPSHIYSSIQPFVKQIYMDLRSHSMWFPSKFPL